MKLVLGKVAVGTHYLVAEGQIDLARDCGGVFAAFALAAGDDGDSIFGLLDRCDRGKQSDPRAFVDARAGFAGDAEGMVNSASCGAVVGSTDHSGDHAPDVLLRQIDICAIERIE